jgi:hypothetical protein
MDQPYFTSLFFGANLPILASAVSERADRPAWGANAANHLGCNDLMHSPIQQPGVTTSDGTGSLGQDSRVGRAG